jgi:cytochrome oxidase assembly protein ShyY1
LATVVLVALGIALGNWQLRRAAEKEAIGAAILERGRLPPVVIGGGGGEEKYDRVGTSPHPTTAKANPTTVAREYRRVRITGEFVAGWPVFLDNRPYQGRAGFYLAMPFKIAGSDRHVLVLRGWLPRDPREYTRLPNYETPRGTTTIEGILVASAGHVLQLGAAAPLKPGALVQNLEVDALARAGGLKLEPLLVQQTGPRADGEVLVRDWPAPDTGIDKHRGYAVQWYALAAMAALFFVITGFRSGRKQAE